MRGLVVITTVSPLLLLQSLNPCASFVTQHSVVSKPRSTQLFLYDDDEPPVPRFVADTNKNNDKQQDDTDNHLSSVPRLFEFNQDGTEVRSLLPRLSRTLTSGVECYFEETDRKVVNLSRKLACHPMDAAWALEVFQGDATEAWLAISTARKMLLNEQDEEEEDFDAELFEMLAANKEVVTEEDDEDYEERKERLKKEKRLEDIKQATKDTFSGGEVDGKWLPRENPNPVDDEPWFTG